MNEDPPTIVLRIQMDPCELDWTHLSGPKGTTVTLQDLPTLLQERLRPFLVRLKARAIEKFAYDGRDNPHVRIDGRRFELQPLALGEDAAEVIRLTSWWIEYCRCMSVRNACSRQGKRLHDHWLCPDCKAEVAAKRDLCNNSHCSSWDNRHACTGEPSLRPVERTA